MSESRPVGPTFVREDARGTFVEVVNAGPWETVATATMHRGSVLGNHYHKRARLYLYIMRGSADVHRINLADGARSQCRLAASEGVILEPHVAHAIKFREESNLLLLKSQRYGAEDPDTYPYAVLPIDPTNDETQIQSSK